ncbi:hypothetical protein CTI12_AA557020 [Artemisia annua]|uniref:Uncharacterized protein n=1 Tax=Artemisia annua TaxID=35608 RepID=A0A2U1KWD2_ARTAN|nr:hypothetical protein CTI12_AA557020 [Artemisia annua]
MKGNIQDGSYQESRSRNSNIQIAHKRRGNYSSRKNSVHDKRHKARFSFKWVPTGRKFVMNGYKWSCDYEPIYYTKKNKESPNGPKAYLTNSYTCASTLFKSAGHSHPPVNPSSGYGAKRTKVWIPKALGSPNLGDHNSQYLMTDSNVMESSVEAPAPPTRTDDEILPYSKWVPIGKK